MSFIADLGVISDIATIIRCGFRMGNTLSWRMSLNGAVMGFCVPAVA